MNPAAVGFQCPECVAEGRRSVRHGTTVFGGGLQGERGTVTRALLGTNIGVWLLTLLAAAAGGGERGESFASLVLGGGVTDLVAWGASTPAEVFTDGTHTYYSGGIAGGELWRLVTAGFLHYGIIHLALNMYALWLLGPVCERLLGRWRFLALYLLAGVGGATAELLFSSPGTYGAGASGSIFGLMAALIFFGRKLALDLRPLLALVGVNLLLGFMIPGISVLGHLGGLVVGGAVGAIFAYAPTGPQQSRWQGLGLVAVVALMGILIAGRIASYGLL
jgi:membrane associated rhomboid family serine protease